MSTKVNRAKITRFERLVKEDRRAALRELADAITDSYDLDDLKKFLADVHCGDLPWEPLHTLTDEQIVETMIDTAGWDRELDKED